MVILSVVITGLEFSKMSSSLPLKKKMKQNCNISLSRNVI